MAALRPDLPPLPRGLATARVADNGYPVPWFVLWVPLDPDRPEAGSRPEFRATDPRKMLAAIRQRLCWVCGDPLHASGARGPVSFVVGPMCTANRISAEPPSHYECACFSAVACPFLSKPHMSRRTSDLSETELKRATEAVPGHMISRNPGVTAVWTTTAYQAFRAPTPDGGEGVLFDIGRLRDPVGVDWFTEGRAAARAEVEAAFETGCGSLFALAESAADKAAVTAALVAAERFWPKE